MNNYRTQFMSWWHKFQKSDHELKTAMENTVENSPHHREDNVWVHTQMVVSHYIEFVDSQCSEWDYLDLQGAVACVFHDFGKPDTEEEFYSEKYERVIRSYKNHEIVSAGHFMNFWCENEHNIKSLISDDEAFYNVWVLIAYHLPYNMGDANVANLKTHVSYYNLEHVITNVLLADCHGRIQDDREGSIKNCYSWINDFNNLVPKKLNDDESEIMMLVGVTGSGKTTYVNRHLNNENYVKFSYDDVRYKLFPNEKSYRDVYHNVQRYFDDEERDPSVINTQLGIGDPKKLYGHNETLQMAMREALKNTPNDSCFVVDNMSLSRKYRRVINSMNKNRSLHAVMFIRSKDELYKNEDSRPDHEKRGKHVIDRMYYGYFPVLLGEADRITLITN